MTEHEEPPVGVARHAATAIPFILTAFLTLAALVPIHTPILRWIGPSLPLIAVYYWAVHRPDLLPRLAVFLIGLAIDMLHGTPIGTAALSYALVYEIVVRNRRYLLGKPFRTLWAGMAGVAPAAYAVQWFWLRRFKACRCPTNRCSARS